MTNKELEEFNKHRKIWQICAVTNDLERTMQQWVDKLKIGPWKVRSFNSENMDYEYVGDRMLDKEKEPWEFRIGITMVGDFEIEIIQPVKGPTIFQDWLDRHGEGIHHLKRRLPMRKSCKNRGGVDCQRCTRSGGRQVLQRHPPLYGCRKVHRLHLRIGKLPLY